MLFFVQKSARFGQITRTFYAISQKLFKIIQKFQLHVKIQTFLYQKHSDLSFSPKKRVLVKFKVILPLYTLYTYKVDEVETWTAI